MSVEDRVLFAENVLVRENVQKSSGLPTLPKGREDLGTFERMHVLNPINPSRKLEKRIIRLCQRAVGKQAKSKFA